MKLSVKQYADIKNITPQAVTKRIRKNAKENEVLSKGLSGALSVEKVGNSYIIITR